jgi:g-D-glutamyl-meso-diaminopimelate peptidase
LSSEDVKKQNIFSYIGINGGDITLDFERECDYAMLIDVATQLSNRFSFLDFNYLGESVMGRGIPLFKIGCGEKKIYYIGAHHGAERITATLLLKFVYEFCLYHSKGINIFGINTEFVAKFYTLIIIPMLNPDGVEIALGRVGEDSLFYERLVRMNGSADFKKWQANARGVDLNHNYDAGFDEYKAIEKSLGISGGAPTRFSGETPESEPETSVLCNYFRFFMPRAVMTLHTQGREIYYTSGGEYPKGAKTVAMHLASLSGYTPSEPNGTAAYGGLTDFCIQKLGVPSFTVECGKGQNPLPPNHTNEIYAELRRALFTFPTMF